MHIKLKSLTVSRCLYASTQTRIDQEFRFKETLHKTERRPFSYTLFPLNILPNEGRESVGPIGRFKGHRYSGDQSPDDNEGQDITVTLAIRR